MLKATGQGSWKLASTAFANPMTQQRVGIRTLAVILAVRERAKTTFDRNACQALSIDLGRPAPDEMPIQGQTVALWICRLSR